jgi:hypothetical protein
MEMMDLSDAIEAMDRSNEASVRDVEQQLAVYMNALDTDFQLLSTQAEPNIASLGVWYQKSQYLGRLRKNFEGIAEI